MKMSMTQKILAKNANLDFVKPGQLINCNLDIVMGNDITTAIALKEFKKTGATKVFDSNKIAIVMDHFTPNKDIKAAKQCKACRNFAYDMNIENFFDVGEVGIEHALLPEKGIVSSGEVIIGADSHTCTYGAIGAFSTGVGSTDMAVGMVSGQAWFKVPEAIRFEIIGKKSKYISGKDVILHIIGLIGVAGALYKSMEFVGSGISELTMDDRFTMANMAVEAGAKNGIFIVDNQTMDYLNEHTKKAKNFVTYDEDYGYEKTYTIDLSELKPTIAFPHLPDNTRTNENIEDILIDQVVIGSCTNGRISDMEEAYKILSKHEVKKGVRCIIIPATQKIYLDCVIKGYTEAFVRSKAVFSVPTCGPCLGGHMGILADGEKCVSTTNRNFVGRMGDVDSEIFLASPLVAACSAVLGKIASFEEVKELMK